MPVMLGGSRHYGLVSADPWECPACGAEQTGPIPDGCTACGRGKPGQRHVPEQTAGPLLDAAHAAFALWDAKQVERPSLLQAFIAGYHCAVRTDPMKDAPPLPERTNEATLTPAGAQARTLAAALALFIEQALVNQPEEIESGEWLDLPAARALLSQLQIDGRK